MPPTQLPLTLAQHHNNQQLFSDHYLDITLPQRPEWRLLAHDAGLALAKVAPIVRDFLRAPAQNEAQTEDDLIKPVLRALGHTFEIQAALKTPDGTKKPDYIFYRDQAALQANKSVKVLDEAGLQSKALAIGDAKHWDRPLDVNLKTAGDPFSNKNPAYQIAFYIQHSGATWGILTNGRLWRLYHRDSAYKQDRFYEVDLPALVAANDPEAFLYFYAFFHRSAFDDHPLGLAALLRESADYARGIGESLRDQVYDALRHLAQGFLDYPGNRLAPEPATLKQIYDHSLIVLYRLLFILYAEARELLPLRESAAYRADYSLDALKREIGRRKTSSATLLPTTARLWARLKDLFQIIDVGSPPLKVATFDGGLFDPERHAFLEQYTVGDARLLEAIDKLARVGEEFIDYRDLAERHLGTIYEGLLEYHLEPLTPRPPLPAAGEGENWSIDLFNDRGERHRTGSYYTPDFVVQYIVEQTLRPVLDAAVAGKPSDADKINAVLSVNCLDPAMGSGHFPVAAMEYIARYLVDLGVTPENQEPRTENQRPYPGSRFSVLGSESDLAYWKRRVAQNCIYGVDLNPLAVDLAKLSLWLATAAKDKPLSFLDHHLRCGNALVGVRVADLRGSAAPKKPRASKKSAAAAGQISMLDDPDFAHSIGLAVGSMWLIEETAGDTIAEVREQERLYADLRAELTRKHQQLADVATARDFGLNVDATLWKGLSDYLTRGGFEVPQYATVLKAAGERAAAQRFFHWDLEFPEVFFDRFGQPLGERGGFDAVIGNPPYVRQEQLAPIKPYLQAAYPETYHGMADLYVYFYQQGLRLLRQGGRMSFIVTNKWMRAGYGEPLRAFFAKESAIEQIIDFGHAPIFEDADVFPCIIVLRKPWAGALTPQPPLPRRGEGEQDIAVERWEIAAPLRAKMIEVARQFRKEPTASEAILWQALRGKQLDGRKFRRQQPIGPFVVDFFCPSERLIVEVDGPIHDQQREADHRRQELLESLGLRFVRLTTADIETNLDGALAIIRAALLPPLPGVGEGGRGGEGENLVHVTSFPREALKLVQLGSYVRKYSHPVPQSRFSAAPWSLEASDVDDLMAKIKRAGVPLAEFAGVKPYYGIKTGLNEAFLVDTPTKDRLIREDPRSAEIIKPYLRGQDIKRWSPEWDGMSVVLLKSSGDYSWSWSNAGEHAEEVFQQTFPALYNYMKPLEAKLKTRQDKGRYWWELRSCAYYNAFNQPKLMYQVIQFHPQYGYDTSKALTNDKGFFLPISNFWLLAILNSPLMWWHNWRYLPHMKDEALNPAGFLIEQIPIAPPTDAIRAEVEPAVERLIAITRANQQARRDTLDWLRAEFGVEAPGQKLEAFAALDEAAFVEEVRKRRPKSAGKLSPAALRALREGYVEQAMPVQQRQAEALKLERRLADLVNQAYGLTPEEVDLLWRTAPPRTPVGRS